MDDSLILHTRTMHMATHTAISLSMYRTHGQESLCILNTFCLGTEEETVPMMLTSRLLKISNYMNKNKITKLKCYKIKGKWNSPIFKVYDGSSTSAPLLATLCGATLPSTLHSTGRDLYFNFVVNRSGSRGRYFDRGAYDITYTSSMVQGQGRHIKCMASLNFI